MLRWLVAVLLAASLFVACAPGALAPNTTSVEGQVVTATNADRDASGLPSLAWNSTLGQNAVAWAQHMAATGTFAHQDLAAVILTGHFNTLGENILESATPLNGAVIESYFMASPAHRANILSGAFHWIGVGIATGGGTTYVAVEFGG